MNKSALFISLLSMHVSLCTAIIVALLMPYFLYPFTGWIAVILSLYSATVSYRAAVRELRRYK